MTVTTLEPSRGPMSSAEDGRLSRGLALATFPCASTEVTPALRLGSRIGGPDYVDHLAGAVP